jgi:hypothetical protein
LTCEWTGDDPFLIGAGAAACEDIAAAFGSEIVGRAAHDSLGAFHVQAYGKFVPIDEKLRKNLVLRLTTERGIYSLGRFATWRNLLLDDVVHDAAVIKALASSSEYDRRIQTRNY